MSKKEKIIKKIKSLSNISFEEAKNLLDDYGYIFRSVGSHYTFRKKNRPSVTIVKRKNSIHKDAVKDLKKIVEAEESE